MTERVNQNREGSTVEGSETPSPRARKIFGRLVMCFWLIIGGYFVIDHFFYRTIDCTVTSAEASSSGGGLRVSGSQQRIYVETQECGTVTFVEMQNEGFDTAQDLADELNRHQGEKLRFHISYFQFKNHEARAVELEGYPIHD